MQESFIQGGRGHGINILAKRLLGILRYSGEVFGVQGKYKMTQKKSVKESMRERACHVDPLPHIITP